MSEKERVLNFTPQVFQKPFLLSTARYPAFIARWGSGKTMCLIVKGVMLSEYYPNNTGMIFRKTERSLRKSTIRDFQEYTPWRVPITTNEITIPGTASNILFGHADDKKSLEGMLQNINLGWAGIEQAEELDSSEIFDMLRGRLRKILTPNLQIQQKLVKLKVLKEPVDDFRALSDKQRDKCIDTITGRLKIPYHQLMVIGNTKGHNWIYKRWKKQVWPEYVLSEEGGLENVKYLPKDTVKDWARMKAENPRKFNRYIMNSWEDYDIEGAYYAAQMSDALKEGRTDITTLFDPTARVYTFWDLGIRAKDSTAIWFVQFVGNEIWLVDYYEDSGQGMSFYSQVLNSKNYNYAAHFLPPDAVQRLQAANIETRYDIFTKLRREPVYVVERHLIADRIEAVRSILNRCRFSVKASRGVDALNNYRRDLNDTLSTDETQVYKPSPRDDEWTNGADSFGYLAIAYRYQMLEAIGGGIGGNIDLSDYYGTHKGVVNLLEI